MTTWLLVVDVVGGCGQADVASRAWTAGGGGRTSTGTSRFRTCSRAETNAGVTPLLLDEPTDDLGLASAEALRAR